ncbi:MAG: hypothetical protein QOI41_5848 [Myxococcales bacterium]|nr:hypothetical protein [Myxococcales bacterium]
MKAAEAPLPAPAGLLADVYVPTPNASWAKLQRGIGGAVGILPASAGGIICTAAGLDPFIASEIDGTAPIYGVVAGDPMSPSYVIAMKLLDLRKARVVLVDGETARYSTREAGAMTELLPKGQSERPPVAIGLSPNGYILVARRSEDLGTLAPYVTRTLPKRPLPVEGAVVFDVPRAALASAMKPKLDEGWASAKSFLLGEDERMRRNHGGRAPDFGDPKAIVSAVDAWVTRRIGVVGDLEKMRIAVEVIEDGLSIVSTMTPAAGGGEATKWTDGMKLGDLAPIGVLPATSAAALLMRDGEEDRAEQGRAFEQAVTSALGPRLAEADAKKLHVVVDDVTKARGEVLAGAVAWDDPQGLGLRAPVRDPDAATRAVRGGVDLLKIAPFKELLHVRDVTMSSEELAGVGKMSLATVAREQPKRPGAPGDRDAGAPKAPGPARNGGFGVAWSIDGGVLSLATGESPVPTLRATAHPDRKLSDEPAIARSFTALGNQASAVLIVQPLRFDATRANLPAAPLLFALGRKDKDATLRIDIANGLLRELARRQMGL